MKHSGSSLAFRLRIALLSSLMFMTIVTTTGAPANAAPIPGTSSSKLVAPELGLFRSPIGFQITAGGSGWVQAEPPIDNAFIATVYRSPGGRDDDASLTVRIDDLERETSIDRYIQKWTKEYPRYGFDVLGAKPFSQGKHKAFVLDILNRDTRKQLRQVVFMRKQKAVILTCRDQATRFNETLKGCNQIIRSFSWIE